MADLTTEAGRKEEFNQARQAYKRQKVEWSLTYDEWWELVSTLDDPCTQYSRSEDGKYAVRPINSKDPVDRANVWLAPNTGHPKQRRSHIMRQIELERAEYQGTGGRWTDTWRPGPPGHLPASNMYGYTGGRA